jgi:hypothetical protein
MPVTSSAHIRRCGNSCAGPSRMTNEPAERRRKIIGFLNGLSQREKLMVLACLGNDSTIHAKIPDLTKTVLEMQRAHYRAELLALAETERSNLDLRLLARRKGCQLEPKEGPADLWCIVSADDRAGNRPWPAALTRNQVLHILRSLPDRRGKA